MKPKDESGKLTADERPLLKMAELVFVYNAESGLLSAVTDIAHKAFSPQTYQCNLCSLTHSTFGVRKSWKRFLETLEWPLEFLHADELKRVYGVSGVPLPAVFKKEVEGLKLLIDADAINACRTTDDLKKLCEDRLTEEKEELKG